MCLKTTPRTRRVSITRRALQPFTANRSAVYEALRGLVAYGIRSDGHKELIDFMAHRCESQAAWEGLLYDLARRGLQGRLTNRIVTDGCKGLHNALEAA